MEIVRKPFLAFGLVERIGMELGTNWVCNCIWSENLGIR